MDEARKMYGATIQPSTDATADVIAATMSELNSTWPARS